MTVDKNCQMVMEFKKNSNKYMENNARRDSKLTSWTHSDESYPWKEMPMKKIYNELSIMDWEKFGWDYENAM
jgi:hypothetical protein